MIVNIIKVYVKKDHIEGFKEVTHENHINSIKEPGNFRFDVLQDDKDPGLFILYEAFESQEAINAHKETAHFFKWRDTVSSWMEKPREGARYAMLFPDTTK